MPIKAPSLLILLISVIMAASYVLIRYFGARYFAFIDRQPEMLLLIGYVLLLLGVTVRGL